MIGNERRAHQGALDVVVERSRAWFAREQAADGYWWAELESNATMDAEYLLLTHFLGARDDDDRAAFRQGDLANYAVHMQTGSPIDTALRGIGYPARITPASLLPQDNLTRMRKQYAEMGGARNNTRFGWMRTRG